MDYEWRACPPTEAEAVILVLPTRKNRKLGPSILCMWKSGAGEFCPVWTLALMHRFNFLLHCEEAGRAQVFTDRKVFIGVSTKTFSKAVSDQGDTNGFMGIDGHSVRVSGTVTLKAHLDQGLDMEALQAAGGWTTESMPIYYGGPSAEQTRTWAWRMVKPVLRLSVQ